MPATLRTSPAPAAPAGPAADAPAAHHAPAAPSQRPVLRPAVRVGRLPLEALLDTRAVGIPSALDVHPGVLRVDRRHTPAAAPPRLAVVHPIEDEAAQQAEARRRALLAAAAWLGSAAVTGLSLAAALG